MTKISGNFARNFSYYTIINIGFSLERKKKLCYNGIWNSIHLTKGSDPFEEPSLSTSAGRQILLCGRLPFFAKKVFVQSFPLFQPGFPQQMFIFPHTFPITFDIGGFYTMESFMQVFEMVKAACHENISDVAFNLWIDPLEPVKLENDTAYLFIKTEFQKNIINTGEPSLCVQCHGSKNF